MARDMLKKKQRIAHNVSNGSHEMVSEGHALVSGFIEEIKKNDLSALNFSNFEPNLPGTSNTFVKKKPKIIPVPIQNHASVPKKSRNSHKFPLMESAVKTLKHIKHNRHISKPKAHLATLSDSSSEYNSPCYNNLILHEKSKTNPVKIDQNNSTDLESAIIPKNSVREKSQIVNSDKISDDSSDSNMFETFVAKNSLKSYKNEKDNCKKLQKSTKITKRFIEKPTTSESDSEMSDESSALSKKNKKNCKIARKRHAALNKVQSTTSRRDNVSESVRKKHTSRTLSKSVSQESDSDTSDKSFYWTKSKRMKSHQVTSKGGSESEMDIVDDMDHDSDDGDLPAPSEIFSCLLPDTYNASQSIKQTDNVNNAVSEFNSSSHKNCLTPFESNVHFLALPKTSDISSAGVKEEPHILLTKESSNKASSTKNDQSSSKCFTTKTGSIQKNSNESVIVDLTESDNECENSFSTMPKIIMTSDQESEVEMVDVIVPELLENTNMESANKNVRFNCANDCIKTEKPDDCEIVLDIASTNKSNLNLPGMQIHNRNIKTEKDSNIVRKVAPVRVAKSGSISIEQTNQSSIISNIENSQILSENIKKESYDDCEIVLDITSATNSNLNLPGVQTCDKILTDRHNKNSELVENERITESGSENIGDLVEYMKKEFFTYREIVQTGESVENTFKMLEKCQAKKLKSLQNKITQILECTQGNAVDKVLDSSELSSSSLKDCSNVSSESDISLQDLKTLATMNLVPLSSISENDIKPNLSELQFSLKQEPGTSGRRNSMDKNWSFGQKCMVCNKDASAACQQCCKVFFCSNECGNKYWEDGHKNACRYL